MAYNKEPNRLVRSLATEFEIKSVQKIVLASVF